MRSEPRFIYRVQTYQRDPIEGYNVTVTEWSDENYTILASAPGRNGHDIIVDDDELGWDTFPSDEEIERIIEERLEERFENPGSITHLIEKGEL